MANGLQVSDGHEGDAGLRELGRLLYLLEDADFQ